MEWRKTLDHQLKPSDYHNILSQLKLNDKFKNLPDYLKFLFLFKKF